jgi:hypothetical protein
MRRAIILVCLALLFPVASGRSRIIDLFAPSDALLDSLEAELDRRGIDVRRGVGPMWGIGSRPQLARLENFFPVQRLPLDRSEYSFEKFFSRALSPTQFL